MANELRPEFPPEAHKQFEAFLGQYDGLRIAGKAATPPVVRPGCDAIVDALSKLERDTRWWTDLAQLELCMIEYLPDATARARVAGWRRRLREVAGEMRYRAYLDAAPTTASAPIADVLADLGECMRGVYYFYAGYGVAATSRDGLIRDLLKFGGIIVGVELLIALALGTVRPTGAFWPTIGEETRTLLIVATWTSILAVIGSLVNVQRRLEDPKVDADPYFRYIQTSADRLSVSFSSPFFGAVFGYIIFGLIASRLIFGSVIPDLTKLDVVSTAFILILGFLAGFAEQLVPDALTRVAARALASVSNGRMSTATGAGVGTPAMVPMILTPSATSTKAGSKITVSVNAPGTMGPITATTTATSILQIGPVSGLAPGPASFDVTTLLAGTGTIVVKAGLATEALDIHVT